MTLACSTTMSAHHGFEARVSHLSQSPIWAGPDLQEASRECAGSMLQRTSQEAEPAEPLSNEALRCYKEGLIDLLRPGEAVFDALRRLGNLQVGLFFCPTNQVVTLDAQQHAV